MKKLTILTSLSSFLMKETAFENILLNSDKFDLYTKTYAYDFNRRLARIKNKYSWYCFEQIEIINFFLPVIKKEDQLDIEDKIINLVNVDNNFHCLVDYEDNDIVQDYIDYVKRGIISSLVVLDITDISREDIVDLAHAMFLYRNDFYIEFYDD